MNSNQESSSRRNKHKRSHSISSHSRSSVSSHSSSSSRSNRKSRHKHKQSSRHHSQSRDKNYSRSRSKSKSHHHHVKDSKKKKDRSSHKSSHKKDKKRSFHSKSKSKESRSHSDDSSSSQEKQPKQPITQIPPGTNPSNQTNSMLYPFGFKPPLILGVTPPNQMPLNINTLGLQIPPMKNYDANQIHNQLYPNQPMMMNPQMIHKQEDKIVKDKNLLHSEEKLFEQTVTHEMSLRTLFAGCQFSEKYLGKVLFTLLKKELFEEGMNGNGNNSSIISGNNMGISNDKGGNNMGGHNIASNICGGNNVNGDNNNGSNNSIVSADELIRQKMENIKIKRQKITLGDMSTNYKRLIELRELNEKQYLLKTVE